jgi:hypothetical protein
MPVGNSRFSGVNYVPGQRFNLITTKLRLDGWIPGGNTEALWFKRPSTETCWRAPREPRRLVHYVLECSISHFFKEIIKIRFRRHKRASRADDPAWLTNERGDKHKDGKQNPPM